MQIREIAPINDPLWEQLIASSESTVFHSPAWLKVLQGTHNFDVSAQVAEQDGVPIAGVPIVKIQCPGGYRRISLPFSDFCEVLGDDVAARQQLAEEVLKDKTPWQIRSRVDFIPEVETPVSSKREFYWHCVDISPSLEDISSSFHKSIRRSVKRSQREGVKIVEATSKDQLREWFQIQLRLRKNKHGMLVQPYSFFEAVWDQFIAQGNGVLLLAVLDDKIIGGEIDLIWKNVIYAKFAAVDLEYMHLRVNHLLTWSAIEYGKQRGLETYDLGRTGVTQEGLVEFKRGFRPTEYRLDVLTFCEGEEFSPAQQEFNDVIGQLSQIFTKEDMPDEITEAAGQLLYRQFA